MHIVQALAALSVGGSELVAVELTEALRRAGHRVTVLAADGPLAARVREAGGELLDWPVGRKRPTAWWHARRLARWLERERPEIIHAHSRMPAWVCERALQAVEPAQRPAWVTSVHGRYSVNAYSAVMTRGDRVVCVSDSVRDYTLANYPDTDSHRVVTIHGGASADRFPYGFQPGDEWRRKVRQSHPELDGRQMLLLPGRLSRYKGHPVFFEMLALLSARHPRVHGLVIGGGRAGSSYARELKRLARRLKITDRLTMLGPRDDLREWMAISDVVVNLTSGPAEAFGRTVLEALRLGRPVVAWDHGGAAEILARMFPEGAVPPDDAWAFRSRISEFLDRPPAVPDSGAFTLRESMQRHLDLYVDLNRNLAA